MGTDLVWMRAGACRDASPTLFFPRTGVGVALAQQVCSRCPVRSECLEHALANRIAYGVWGGRSERERQRILRARAARATLGPGRPRGPGGRP